MSLPEVLLWQQLRKAPNGAIFHRQYSITERVTVDFYCAKAKVCIEVDGLGHSMGDAPQRDENRDATLQGLGFEVLRITASDVLNSPEAVADALVRYCKR